MGGIVRHSTDNGRVIKNMSDNFSRSKFLETDKGQIAYFFNNEFSGRPTVVCLHGLSSNHTTWNVLTRALRPHRINILAVDQRGHGHSDKTKNHDWYKFPVFTEDLRRIIVKENLSKVILLGYSYGGFIALDFIDKYPEKVSCLILISTSHVSPWRYQWLSFFTWSAHYILDFFAWLVLWHGRKQYLYFNYEHGGGYWKATFNGLLTMPLSINFWMLAEIAHVDFSGSISKITCPTLLIKSKKDALVSERGANDMLQKIKPAKLAIFDVKTHFLGTRYQEKIADEIINFLKEQNIISRA